ncbi:MAG: tetratricopeptide repeat protein [Verrucomicrobia bacterium]|nr:tetratricopeptide repeat protein [Verrucomicrobiota bacterium]
MRFLLGTVLALFSLTCARAAEASAGFDQANKLYEEGKFSEAVTAYQKLITSEQSSPALFFNLGNALFKAGQPGRAVLWYRRAEALAPRDPDIKANLHYIRKNVNGGATATKWRARLQTFSLNEWTTFTVIAGWVWFALLTLREWQPNLRPALRGGTMTAGVLAGVLGAVLFLVWQDEFQNKPAVVIVSEAVVRRGPLEESQSYFHLRDGAELTVLDQKENWLQVSDAANRIGWVRREQIELVHPASPAASVKSASRG